MTLDVIRDEDVLGKVSRVGREIDTGLREPAARHGAIGDVRGAGLHANVLKIRPPLVFSSADGERLLGTLEAVLQSLNRA